MQGTLKHYYLLVLVSVIGDYVYCKEVSRDVGIGACTQNVVIVDGIVDVDEFV